MLQMKQQWRGGNMLCLTKCYVYGYDMFVKIYQIEVWDLLQ